MEEIGETINECKCMEDRSQNEHEREDCYKRDIVYRAW